MLQNLTFGVVPSCGIFVVYSHFSRGQNRVFCFSWKYFFPQIDSVSYKHFSFSKITVQVFSLFLEVLIGIGKHIWGNSGLYTSLFKVKRRVSYSSTEPYCLKQIKHSRDLGWYSPTLKLSFLSLWLRIFSIKSPTSRENYNSRAWWIPPLKSI